MRFSRSVLPAPPRPAGPPARPGPRWGALFRAVSCALLLAGLTGCYLTEQALHLLGVNSKAEDNERVLGREDTPAEVRRTLALVSDVKRYSVERLGLADNGNYTRYVDMGEKTHLVDVVSACDAVRFQPHLWNYPFLGRMPYKGFFERKDAEREARRLRQKGYDTAVWEVDAFSTLGVFSDPVFSFMAEYSAYTLAAVIIHEQTHATVFFKNQGRFNEEFATFVGDEGAVGFIRERFSSDPGMVEAALAHRRGLESRLAAVRELYDGLDALYGRGGDREEVLERKRAFIERFGERYRELHGRDFETGGMELNNAYLMTLITYTGDLSLFRELNEKFDGDLAATVRFVRGIAGDGAGGSGRRGTRGLRTARGDPKDVIREYLAGPPVVSVGEPPGSRLAAGEE